MNVNFKIAWILSISVVFVLGLILGSVSSRKESVKIVSTYDFVNEELGSVKPVIQKHEYQVLRSKIREYISNVSNNDASQVSIYFRDLQIGPTFGINEQDEFVPASLLKVPVMITLLSIADENEAILSKKVTVTGEGDNLIPEFKPARTIESNKEYTIEELIEAMIIYSDNKAYDALVVYVNKNYPSKFHEVFGELGIIDPSTQLEETISVKSYSSIFRQLYHSSYLSLEMSEKALEILSRSEFKEGLTKSIPSSIKVSNKFGEREIIGEDDIQFHDCGIIYYPDNPYLLCIMTEGKDLETSLKIIQDISGMVYEEVDSRRID